MNHNSLTNLKLFGEYDQKTLAQLWGYESYDAIRRGIFTPKNNDIIILFVTEKKVSYATQYSDKLDGSTLYMAGENKHGHDKRLLNNLNNKKDTIYLFYRAVHHTPFIYYGPVVLKDAAILKEEPSHFEFEVLSLLNSNFEKSISVDELTAGTDELAAYGETIAEAILNGTDDTAGIKLKSGTYKVRHLSKTISDNLKKLYGFRCQICGIHLGEHYGSNLIHAHHIDYFSKSKNNDASNIMIVCPNHHSIIHDQNPVFDKTKKALIYPNGYIEELKLNFHL